MLIFRTTISDHKILEKASLLCPHQADDLTAFEGHQFDNRIGCLVYRAVS